MVSFSKVTGMRRVSLDPLTCVVPSGSCLRKFFENTRDAGLGEQTLVSTRLPKNF
jgi:hypothetical protein